MNSSIFHDVAALRFFHVIFFLSSAECQCHQKHIYIKHELLSRKYITWGAKLCFMANHIHHSWILRYSNNHTFNLYRNEIQYNHHFAECNIKYINISKWNHVNRGVRETHADFAPFRVFRLMARAISYFCKYDTRELWRETLFTSGR